jgi:hypothetical protein
VNFTRARRAPSHTGIGSSPRQKKWKREWANGNCLLVHEAFCRVDYHAFMRSGDARLLSQSASYCRDGNNGLRLIQRSQHFSTTLDLYLVSIGTDSPE